MDVGGSPVRSHAGQPDRMADDVDTSPQVARVRAEQSATDRNHAYGATHLGREHDVVADEVGQRLDEQQVSDCLNTLTATQREAIAWPTTAATPTARSPNSSTPHYRP